MKIYTLAIHSTKIGTEGHAFTTQADAYRRLLAELDLENDDAANALLDAGNFKALEELLQDSDQRVAEADPYPTWEITAHTLRVAPSSSRVRKGNSTHGPQ